MKRAGPFVLRLAVLSLSLAGAIAGRVWAAELTFDIRIEQGRVPDAMRLMRVSEGDTVILRWSSDRPLTLHLHGYDIEKSVAADGVTELKFTAYATGRFPIEIHAARAGKGGAAHGDTPLAVIEVYPH